MSEDAPVDAAAPMGKVARLIVVTGLLGVVAGVMLLVGIVPRWSRTLAEREAAPRLSLSDLEATAPGVAAFVEARVSSEQDAALGDVVAHEEWERRPKGGRTLRSHARPEIVIEEGERRARLAAERYVLERVGPVELGPADQGDESLAVRRGDVITAFGTTGSKSADGTPVFAARVVVLGTAEASLAALRSDVSRLRLTALACMAAAVPGLVLLLARWRRRVAGRPAA